MITKYGLPVCANYRYHKKTRKDQRTLWLLLSPEVSCWLRLSTATWSYLQLWANVQGFHCELLNTNTVRRTSRSIFWHPGKTRIRQMKGHTGAHHAEVLSGTWTRRGVTIRMFSLFISHSCVSQEMFCPHISYYIIWTDNNSPETNFSCHEN